jgi:predicted  nucleic acid-binding Zn-ribbon protein
LATVILLGRGLRSVLKALVELQRIEIGLREVQTEKERGPGRLAELEENFRAAEAEVGAAKHRHEQLKVERSQGELELKALEEKLAKYQAQLMEVRTSKEYSAVLKEIDSAKTEISRLEDDLLAKIEEMSGLEKDVPEAEARIAEEKGRYDTTRSALEKELADVDERLATFRARREEIEKEIPPEVVDNFCRVADARGGVAVVRVKEPTCPACNVRIRMQVFAEIRRGESLVTCDTCRRFLYYEENDESAGLSMNASTDAPDAATGPGT